MQKLKDERASIARQRQRVEDDKNKLEQDRASFESRKVPCICCTSQKQCQMKAFCALNIKKTWLTANELAGVIVNQAELLSQFETTKTEELRKLQRDRRVLEKQSRALLKLPTKRDKEDLQALEVCMHGSRNHKNIALHLRCICMYQQIDCE